MDSSEAYLQVSIGLALVSLAMLPTPWIPLLAFANLAAAVAVKGILEEKED